jgi:hypothetical protein
MSLAGENPSPQNQGQGWTPLAPADRPGLYRSRQAVIDRWANRVTPLKLILRIKLSPGDDVVLSAAVRDLHQCYPNRFITDIRTPSPQLWENNPYITPLQDADPEADIINMACPLAERANITPYHFISGFMDYLNRCLGLNIEPTVLKGDIHLSPEEKSSITPIQEIIGRRRPYWLINSGGKLDLTIKWWDHRRYQEVVDYFQGKILFVQIGRTDHYHPPLQGVVDLRGKTDLRQLVRWVYHAQGVVSPVSLLMHLAAALEPGRGAAKSRPCVVVAGGREPPSWVTYQGHQFIHTVGALACCAKGGCWKKRTRPLGDGDPKDTPENMCLDVLGDLPRCMDMITAADVIRRMKCISPEALSVTAGELVVMTGSSAR